MLRLGLLLIVTFLAAQITLEFNRPATMDYAQFIFALMGLLVGLGDRFVAESLVSSSPSASSAIRLVSRVNFESASGRA